MTFSTDAKVLALMLVLGAGTAVLQQRQVHPSSTPNPVFPGFYPLDPNKIKHLALLFEFFCSGNIIGF